ncbi:MAG: bifunctional ornithine acetyltransferase/N-acetylglutamate synthase [Opitutaceae bacterium]|jgi:glutamate N-acetyltransferase/amino-acid N-acetyltransferase|nr:bifunctional ornithine acetyltransferase/N-acetylglutamate synthase [Opitutaceae bacterium]
MGSTSLSFASRNEHRAWLAANAALPEGFRVATTRVEFTPVEAPKPSAMTLSLIALDEPTDKFAAVFTKNAFPGAPVVVGRRRLAAETLGAVLVNTKVSNVCAPGGVEASERLCAETARLIGLPSGESVLPSSTGVIGWRLPVDAMAAALPRLAGGLSRGSALPLAEGIVTTDLYPKLRSAPACGGRVLGVAKGAGMIEPNLATMLVFILTDVAVPRALLRDLLPRAVNATFNRISIDSDTSTSDTVALLSSGKAPFSEGKNAGEFEAALRRVCGDLAEDVVRNGEGVRHVIRVSVTGATDDAAAVALGKAVVNAPLFKCAVAGNDANVGRLVQAIGKCAGAAGLDVSGLRASLGGVEIFADGEFRLDRAKEEALAAHLRGAELYASAPGADGVFRPPVDFPRHERRVEAEVSLGAGPGRAVVLGGDLTHEYVSENADSRS